MEQRSIPLLGEKTIEALAHSHIAVFGVGGVGGFVIETLARQGVQEFSLFDFDVINESNKNRQIIALTSTLQKKKVDVMRERIIDINPSAVVHTFDIKISQENIEEIDFTPFDYIADCIDDVDAKVLIICKAKNVGVEIISSMGTGNKLDPTKFQIKDISKTTVCPLAKAVRLRLRKLEVTNLKVLFSTEEPAVSCDFVPSVSFVPSVAGILIAREIILDIDHQVKKDKIHLILEGGGMKGVYTAGVLDYFLDAQINFDAIYGVSAGACTACSYLSFQRGRSFHSMVDYVGNPEYASKRSLTKTGNYFNKNFIYYKIPNELIPFDYESAQNNPCKLFATITNIETGKAEYHECLDYTKDIEYVCASSSLPMLAEIQSLDGKGYLDGGVADPIPYFEAKRNAGRCVLVLTKPEGYICSKQNSILMQAMKIKYHKYPNLIKTLERRHVIYNQSLAKAQHDKNCFIIRPSKDLNIDRLETDKKKLEELYNQGYEDAKSLAKELEDFMKP